jgi:hypothetical protein
MAPGSMDSISCAIFRPAPTASRISGYVGMGMVRKRSGPMISTE